MMISLDTETTGLDGYLGCRPFFVTTCDDKGKIRFWQWRVDPLTRQVKMPACDVEAIQELVFSADRIVLHHGKFDITMLRLAGIIEYWPWHKTEDTLIASHILASNLKHDLTSLAMQYLQTDILPLEKRMGEVCKQARTHCRFHIKDWRIAKEGLPELPTASENTWQADMWLPLEVAIYEFGTDDITNKRAGQFSPTQIRSPYNPWTGERKDYWIALEDYSNADSEVTMALWQVMEEEMERRGLTKLYREQMKLPQILSGMEQRGITFNTDNAKFLRKMYKKEVKSSACTCVKIARSYNYELVLPKGSNNHSLLDFCFGEPIDRKKPYLGYSRQWLNLPVVESSDKTGIPSLNKASMKVWLDTLEPKKRPYIFIKALSKKRDRETKLTYLKGYKRFAIPIGSLGSQWMLLNPSLNQTGTNTLRLSSSSPNEQNIALSDDGPYESLRYCFCPRPGREWYSLDAKNIELRIPFYLSGEQALIELFEKSAEPPYYGSVHLLNFSIVYSDVWKKELEAVGIEKVGPHCKKKYGSTLYKRGKSAGLGKQYGAGKKKVDDTFGVKGASELLDENFSKLKTLNDECIKEGKYYGYVSTLPDRKVDPTKGYPILCSRTEHGGILTTTPLNYKTQGSACWVVRRMMVECQKQLDQWNEEEDRRGDDRYFLIMNVHDELVFDFPTLPNKGNLPKVMRLKEIMDSIGGDLIPAIPLPVGVAYHSTNWAESETIC